MATSGNQPNQSSMRDRAHHLAGQVVDKVQETAGRVVGTGQGTGGSQGGQGSGQSGSITDQAAEQVTEQVTSRLDMGKDYVVETITGVAHALRQTGQHLREEGAQPMLAGYVDRGAEQIERIGGHMRQRDATELLAEVEWFARRQPMVFAGGAFALGMLAVRFFRSSGQPQPQTSSFAGTTSPVGSYGGPSPATRGATGGVPPMSNVPQSAGSTGTTTPGTMPGGSGSMPRSQPSPGTSRSTEYTDSGLGLSPSTPAAPGMDAGSLSDRVTPRSTAAPSGGIGTATPGSGAGPQGGSRSGDDSSSSGRTGSGGRNQP